MTKSNHFILGGQPLPLDLHTVWADADGKPLTVAAGPISFDFAFRDIRFAGRFEEGGGRAHLRLVGDVGPMPFSAEAPQARAGLSRIIEAANGALGSTFLVSQGRILLGIEGEIQAPVTATGLVTVTTQFLIPATPYLELIAMYVRPPLAPAKKGESAIRPEWRRPPPRALALARR